MTAAKPVCPARDEFSEKDWHRKRSLEGLAADENGGALTLADCDELAELRSRWSRYLGWRGRVDAYFDDLAKDAARPPHPADPENAIAGLMRERRQGRLSEMRTAHPGTRRDGLANAVESELGREPGTGTDRIARAVADNADRLEANRLKPGGFVW